MDFGVLLIILVFIGIPLFSLYSDNKQKPRDGQALLISALALVGIYLVYYLIQGAR